MATTTRPSCRSWPPATSRQLPVYELRDEGPDHAKRFFAVVFLDGVEQGQGEGRSKKQAEQEAARRAWGHLTETGPPRPQINPANGVGVPAGIAGPESESHDA